MRCGVCFEGQRGAMTEAEFEQIVEKMYKLYALARDPGATAGERAAAKRMGDRFNRRIDEWLAQQRKAQAEPAPPPPEPTPEPYPISSKIERFLQHPLGAVVTAIGCFSLWAILKFGRHNPDLYQSRIFLAAIFYTAIFLIGSMALTKWLKKKFNAST
jgi:hypothetical protein